MSDAHSAFSDDDPNSVQVVHLTSRHWNTLDGARAVLRRIDAMAGAGPTVVVVSSDVRPRTAAQLFVHCRMLADGLLSKDALSRYLWSVQAPLHRMIRSHGTESVPPRQAALLAGPLFTYALCDRGHVAGTYRASDIHAENRTFVQWYGELDQRAVAVVIDDDRQPLEVTRLDRASAEPRRERPLRAAS